MDRLWAPWRMQYVNNCEEDASSGSGAKKAKKSGCIFCDKPAQDCDTDNLIAERGPSCFVILNAFPYNNGHIMVVPYRHVNHPSQLTGEEQAELMATASRMMEAITTISHPDGFNMGMNIGSAAGAGIAAHLHLHVVPRWNGDTNFMPVIGETKVMPQTLEQVYARLTAALENARTTDLPQNTPPTPQNQKDKETKR